LSIILLASSSCRSLKYIPRALSVFADLAMKFGVDPGTVRSVTGASHLFISMLHHQFLVRTPHKIKSRNSRKVLIVSVVDRCCGADSLTLINIQLGFPATKVQRGSLPGSFNHASSTQNSVPTATPS
jgi:hypothetical protein